jgi:hypothetical protein
MPVFYFFISSGAAAFGAAELADSPGNFLLLAGASLRMGDIPAVCFISYLRDSFIPPWRSTRSREQKKVQTTVLLLPSNDSLGQHGFILFEKIF